MLLAEDGLSAIDGLGDPKAVGERADSRSTTGFQMRIRACKDVMNETMLGALAYIDKPVLHLVVGEASIVSQFLLFISRRVGITKMLETIIEHIKRV